MVTEPDLFIYTGYSFHPLLICTRSPAWTLCPKNCPDRKAARTRSIKPWPTSCVPAISDGRLPAGARLPSVRETARSRGLSINTVLAAYAQLGSAAKWKRVRSQVTSALGAIAFTAAAQCSPRARRRRSRPKRRCSTGSRPSSLRSRIPDTIDLRWPARRQRLLPEPAAEPPRRRPRARGRATTDYSLPPGSLLLRREIARHARDLGMTLETDDIIPTNGCMERCSSRCGRHEAGRHDRRRVADLLQPDLFRRSSRLPVIEGADASPTRHVARSRLELLLSRSAQAIVTMPSVHNPLAPAWSPENSASPELRTPSRAGRSKMPHAEMQYATPLAADGEVLRSRRLGDPLHVLHQDAGARFPHRLDGGRALPAADRQPEIHRPVAQPAFLCGVKRVP